MENLRIMSFDLDSFVLVKSKAERSKRVMDYIKNLNVDLALLQGDDRLLFDLLWRNEDYEALYNYFNAFLLKPKVEFVDNYKGIDCGSFVTELGNEKISFYNLKKIKKGSLSEFKNMVSEFDYIENKILVGAFKNVNVDDLCKKYNLSNVCSEKCDNHILVSKSIDVNIVDSPSIKDSFISPMIVDIAYKKVR